MRDGEKLTKSVRLGENGKMGGENGEMGGGRV